MVLPGRCHCVKSGGGGHPVSRKTEPISADEETREVMRGIKILFNNNVIEFFDSLYAAGVAGEG
jgi:hypothetical protein